ncbi:hypothetical protein NJ7G_2909 [Natrinema sp. J7-2]|nr:hypothetical protein NJ7G_2909 [Natrinema sp. J7-2]
MPRDVSAHTVRTERGGARIALPSRVAGLTEKHAFGTTAPPLPAK